MRDSAMPTKWPTLSLREAGVIEIQSRLIANAYELGHPAWSILNDFLENLEGRFVETGLADADEEVRLHRRRSSDRAA